MIRIEDQIISDIKPFINKGNVDGFKEIWNEYYNETEYDREIAWDYIFQKVYLHSALKKQVEICNWLQTIFSQFNPIIQIGLRQMFAYGKYLLNK